MFVMKNLIFLFLVICIKESIGDDDTCEHQVRYSAIFCGAFNCSDRYHKISLDRFKMCLFKSSPEAKELIERGPKMKSNDCIRETKKTVCNVVNDMNEHQGRYADCLSLAKEMAPAFQSCRIVNSGDPFTMMVCADPTKIKCGSDNSMEYFKITRNCLMTKVPGMKDVKNTGDSRDEVCLEEALDVLIKAMEQNKMEDFKECMTSKMGILKKIKPGEECTGFGDQLTSNQFKEISNNWIIALGMLVICLVDIMI